MSNEEEMNKQAKPTAQPYSKAAQVKVEAAQVNIEARIKEITNVNRIVANTLNLINDVDIKGAYAGPVTEIQGWLTGFSQSLVSQIKTLESTLPKKEAPKKIEPKVVSPEQHTAAKPIQSVAEKAKVPTK